MLQLVKKKQKTISLKDHFERRNKILVKRRCGGYGDTLMTKMIFEATSDFDFTFTCPYPYSEIFQNHPYANFKESSKVDESQYGIVYDISTACRVHETKYGLFNTKHRSDIWANHCGIEITNHQMHLNPKKEIMQKCKKWIENPENKPIVLFCPYSKNDKFGMTKSLTIEQIQQTTLELIHMGYLVITTNSERKATFDQLGIQQFLKLNIEEWIAMVSVSDYIISVDTATFHIAGGLKKPLVGIFTCTNGKVYGKYFKFSLVQKHRDNGDWDCGPCYSSDICPKSKEPQKPCLTELLPAEIIHAFKDVVKNNPKTSEND